MPSPWSSAVARLLEAIRGGTDFGNTMTCVPYPTVRTKSSSWPEATIVFAVFLAAQVLDGLLTYIGVSLLGVEVEANVLLASSMAAIGAPGTLIAAKLVACGCGYVLYRTAWHRPLAITAGLVVGVAIVPWLGIMASLLSGR